MKRYHYFFVILILGTSCKTKSQSLEKESFNTEKSDLTIAFGSCNKQNSENKLWDDVLKNNPDLWIWGGDNIYSDTYDMTVLKTNYLVQAEQKDYKSFVSEVKILGTWDDHDYGMNDAGEEYPQKEESQQLFLDFMNVPKTSPRRKQKGVYHSEIIASKKGSVKVILLDTRYFRTALKASDIKGNRYQHNDFGEGTILGEEQWKWLQNELENNRSDFTIIVSSIQLLSYQHGFETWGNFPHEVERMKDLLKKAPLEKVIFLSGDRHISEFSKTEVSGLSYPLVDFTSSGMTHTYTKFDGEPNPYRSGAVISQRSFGVLHFDFEAKSVKMQMRGDNNKLQQELIQRY